MGMIHIGQRGISGTNIISVGGAPGVALGGGGGGFVGAYDAIPNITAAYGMRRLLSSYTGPLLRLRRASDNAESDFGYLANGDLDTAAIATFIAATTGFITTKYDQKGSANVVQSTANAQPLYVASGQNSKPVPRWDGTDDRMATAAFGAALAQPNSILIVGKITNTGGYFMDGLTSGNRHAIGRINSADNTKPSLFAGSLLDGSVASAVYIVLTALFNGASSTLHINGSSAASGNAGAHALDGLTLGDRFSTSSSLLNGDIAEFILSDAGWDATQRQAAEAASNLYWAVY